MDGSGRERALVGILAATYAVAGGAKLLGVEPMPSLFARWGLPRWTMPLVGVAEVAGTALLVHPRTRPFGAAWLGALMAGGLVVQAAARDLAFLPAPIAATAALAAVGFGSGARAELVEVPADEELTGLVGAAHERA